MHTQRRQVRHWLLPVQLKTCFLFHFSQSMSQTSRNLWIIMFLTTPGAIEINSLGHRQFFPYHFLENTKTNLCGRERIGTIPFLSSFYRSGRVVMQGKGKQNWKQISKKTSLTYLFLYYCIKNIIFVRHFSSLPAMCYMYLFSTSTFCYQIRSFSGETSKRHVVEGSDWWDNILKKDRFELIIPFYDPSFLRLNKVAT